MFPDIESLDFVSERVLAKLIDAALKPPVDAIDLGESLYFILGPALPPQPKIEYIDPVKLESKISSPRVTELFLAVDQVLSLMTYSDLIKLRSLEDAHKLELFYKWKDIVSRTVKISSKVTSKDIMAEDSRKRSVLLVAPSERQLKAVEGKWASWAWREIAYDGSKTPRTVGWISEVVGIASVLKKEGVEPVIVLDSLSDYEGYKQVAKRFSHLEVEIPENMAKIGYVRDQSVTWFRNPIICNMALGIRREEELVLNEIYYKLDRPPMARARWSLVNGRILRASMEGGNFFVIKTEGDTVLLTGVGVRGSNVATIDFLANVLPEDIRIVAVPIAGYVNDWKTGAVHLDVVFAYLGLISGTRYALVDPMRMGFYSALEYNRKSRGFELIEFPLLMKQLEIKVAEPPREGASPITMVNMLNLGTGKVVSDEYNHSINKYIERTFGVDVIEVKIPQIEAGGGGVRCTTRELW